MKKIRFVRNLYNVVLIIVVNVMILVVTLMNVNLTNKLYY